MIKKWLTLFLFPLALFGNPICLKDKLSEATPGSYLVMEQSRTYTLLHIYEKSHETLILEEVTIPAARYQQNPMGWTQWLASGAPGHTSWTQAQINLGTGTFEEVFSFTHQGWIDLSTSDTFMTTLLNLPFKEVEHSERRRIGLPPGYGKPDHRKLWQPRLIVSGQPLSGVPFHAWKARWPSDGSELSRKTIEIYLPEERAHAHLYPTYFPYWLEVEGKIGSAKVRVVDSGMGITSPKPRLPHRSPQFSKSERTPEGYLVIHLTSPSYFHDFLLLAEEDTLLGKLVPLPCKAETEGTQVTLRVSEEMLNTTLSPGAAYHFLISPKEDPQMCIETPHPVTYQQFLR